MSNHFVNEYQYTSEMARESISAWFHKKYIIKESIKLCIYAIFCVIFLIISKNVIFLVTLLMPPLIFVLMFRARNKTIKTELERMKVFYGDTVPVVHIEIGENITFTSPKGTNHLAYADIEDIIETENLFVLAIKGKMTLALDKDGFVEGDSDQCKKYLQLHIAKKK